MRSAEPAARRAALVALVALSALSGCASLEAPLKAIQDTVVTPVAEAVAPAPAASAAVAAAPAPEPAGAPVPAAAQRAFDDARRALRAGRDADAQRAFLALTVSHPELGGPHANLGLMHREAGRLEDSVAALEKAVAASPRQPLYFNQLGISYRHLGRFAKAREAYERAIELDPNYAAAHLNLGILHDLYLRESAPALAHYDRYMVLAAGKDAAVGKWVADLKNRRPGQSMLTKKEQP